MGAWLLLIYVFTAGVILLPERVVMSLSAIAVDLRACNTEVRGLRASDRGILL